MKSCEKKMKNEGATQNALVGRLYSQEQSASGHESATWPLDVANDNYSWYRDPFPLLPKECREKLHSKNREKKKKARKHIQK